MRNYIFTCLMLIFTCLIFPGCSLWDKTDEPRDDNIAEISRGDRQPGESTWTIMVYMAADNSLDSFVLPDLNEMELVDLTNEGVEVLVLCDRRNFHLLNEPGELWEGTRLYRIRANAHTIQLGSERLAANLSEYPGFTLTATGDNEEFNMGAPETLSAFITWSRRNYPADRYALLLWNHGNGWWPGLLSTLSTSLQADTSTSSVSPPPLPVAPAICDDYDTGTGTWYDVLTLKEVGSAITAAMAGEPLGLVGMDACYMGLIETAYELSGKAEYLVASELAEPGEGWNYTALLHRFIQLDNNAPARLGQSIVDAYYEVTAQQANWDTYTLASINLNEMPVFMGSLNTFSDALTTADKDLITAARSNAPEITYYHCIDFYGFVSSFVSNQPEITGAGTLAGFLTNPDFIYFKQKNAAALTGLAIYFPYDLQWDMNAFSVYNTESDNPYLSFTENSGWNEFLTSCYQDQIRYRIVTEPNSGLSAVPLMSLYSQNSRAICAAYRKPETNYVFLEAPLARNYTYYLQIKNNSISTGDYRLRISQMESAEPVTYPFISIHRPATNYNDTTAYKAPQLSLELDVEREYTLGPNQEIWFSITLNQ